MGDHIVKEIKLTQGKVALVDDCDFGELSKHKWYAQKGYKTFYAVRKTPRDAFGKQGRVLMHREILQLPHNVLGEHKDGNGLNNQRENIRPASHAQNMRNRSGSLHSSKFKGVYRTKETKPWRIGVRSGGKIMASGYYATEAEAARAYDSAAKRLFGDFAYLNL
jgi:hypothetical protein